MNTWMALCERMVETAEQLMPPELPTDVHTWLRDSRLEMSVQANDAVLAYLQTSRWPAPMSADLQTIRVNMRGLYCLYIVRSDLLSFHPNKCTK
jgi:hypothetical protein